MTLSQDIRRHALNYLRGQSSLKEFEDWFAGESWDVQQGGDDETTALVFEIERALSELTSGYLTDEDFRRFLARLLQGGDWAEFRVLELELIARIAFTTGQSSGAGRAPEEVPA